MWHTELKLALASHTGLSQDALHVHAAIVLYLLAALALRNIRSLLPWLLVLALELGNELLDLQEQYSVGRAYGWDEAFAAGWPEALKDIVNTMIWPTAMLAAAHLAARFRRPRPEESPD
jgi:hypothetical protein